MKNSVVTKIVIFEPERQKDKKKCSRIISGTKATRKEKRSQVMLTNCGSHLISYGQLPVANYIYFATTVLY